MEVLSEGVLEDDASGGAIGRPRNLNLRDAAVEVFVVPRITSVDMRGLAVRRRISGDDAVHNPAVGAADLNTAVALHVVVG